VDVGYGHEAVRSIKGGDECEGYEGFGWAVERGGMGCGAYLMNALPKKIALMKGWMEDCSVERRSQTVPICCMSVH
jgi:hypothetical protein